MLIELNFWLAAMKKKQVRYLESVGEDDAIFTPLSKDPSHLNADFMIKAKEIPNDIEEVNFHSFTNSMALTLKFEHLILLPIPMSSLGIVRRPTKSRS